MTNKEGFIHATEKAGSKIQYYIDTGDDSYLHEAIDYVGRANVLLKEMSEENILEIKEF